MPTKKWNVVQFAAYGACAGLLWSVYKSSPLWGLGGDFHARLIGELIGGLFGGAALMAAIAIIRNMIVRAR